MSASDTSTPNTYGLLRAAEAATNWRAVAMTLSSGVAVFLFIALSGWMARSSLLLGGLLGLVTVIIALIGYSAVGLILMRQAQGQTIGLMEALMQAVFTVHRLLGVALLLFMIFLGVALAALLILFLCKIPGLGPLLFGIAYPVLALVMGLTIAGLFYVGFPLAAPAIWEGNSIFETIARLMVIARRRLLFVIVNLVILFLLVVFLSAVVSFILISGSTAAMGLSSAVGIHQLGGILNLFQGAGFSEYGGMGRMASYTYAFGFGTGLLFMLGAIIPMLTFINGTCLVYLQTVAGLDFGEVEEKLRAGVEEARRRTQEARERANAKINESKAAMRSTAAIARATVAAPVVTAAATERRCNNCQSPLAADDVFCGECGAQNPL